MPLFEYQCQDCEKPFEAFVTTDRKAVCPACGGENLRKMLSTPGMVGAAAGKAEFSCDAPPAMCGAQGGRCGCQ